MYINRKFYKIFLDLNLWIYKCRNPLILTHKFKISPNIRNCQRFSNGGANMFDVVGQRWLERLKTPPKMVRDKGRYESRDSRVSLESCYSRSRSNPLETLARLSKFVFLSKNKWNSIQKNEFLSKILKNTK
jgi:hypothetical protein